MLEEGVRDEGGKQVSKHNQAGSQTGTVATYRWSLCRTLVRNAAWATPSL